MNKKGMTLMELLAVIVILAIILLIAIPQINNLLNKSKLGALRDSALLILKESEREYLVQKSTNKDFNSSNINCSALTNISNDYDICTLTFNSNGKATIRLTGADDGRFAGLVCRGTREQIKCREYDGPEYIYSFERPEYAGEYVVTNTSTCIAELPNILIAAGADSTEINSTEGVELINSLCNNENIELEGQSFSSDLYFKTLIAAGAISYEDASSFLSKENITLVNVEENYEDLRYNDEPVSVFIRWYGDETEFSSSSYHSLCTTYGGNLTCLETTQEAYNENLSKIQTLFGAGNCFSTSGDAPGITCAESTSHGCTNRCSISTNGEVMCIYGGKVCSTDSMRVSCYKCTL